MIPLRIAVKGFLCYREEQAIQFEDASLWMLAGLNGSGKSAVFDGVTYALFGGHRAGKEHAEELINKNCDKAAIEFDFLLDNQRYRVQRTLRRKKLGGATPTQQVYLWRSGQGNEPARWEAVADTSQKRNFDAWVRENIGLTYDTFTSSVLLMQGKAEKFLAAAPKDRFEVLASIVDLERYQRLHERADDKRRQLKEQVEILQLRLNEVAEVDAVEMEAVENRIASARQVWEKTQAEGERYQRLELQAERWQELQARLAEAQQACDRAEQLLAESESIERAAARLAELREALPHLAIVLEQRQRLGQSREKIAALVDEQRDLAARLGEVASTLEQCRQRQALIQESISRDQQRAETVGVRLRDLSGLLARVNLWEQQRGEIARIETALAEIPGDPVAGVAHAQQEHDRMVVLGHALPLLSRLAHAREGLALARQSHAGMVAEETQLAADLEKLTADGIQLAEARDQAVQRRREAEIRFTEAKTLLNQARQQFAQIDELSGAKVCRLCGQELTPGHVREERDRREKMRAAAETRARQLEREYTEAVETEKQAQVARDKAATMWTATQDRIKDCRHRQEENERDRRRQMMDSAQTWRELPEPFRGRVGSDPPVESADVIFPTEADLTHFEEEHCRKPAVLEKLQQAQAVLERWKKLQAEREVISRSLSAQEADLPGEIAGLQAEYGTLESEDVALKAALLTAREARETERQSLERYHRQHQQIGEQLAEKAQQWSAEEARGEECLNALDRSRAALPVAWQPIAQTATTAELERFQVERQGLEEQQAPARMEALAQARAGAAVLRQRVGELEVEAEQVPAEARFPAEQLREGRQAIRQELAEQEAELHRAERTRERLVERREERRQLQEKHLELDRQHHRYRLLAELLGRGRLQLYLVRRAERGIVDYANAVLDRLSDGQLCLRLRGGEDSEANADQVLQLEAYNRTTGQAPIAVSFLSGSQRFRVAVSLALGIGQYASRQHRPIESVIIDEGFGCLDRQGRQGMIQELQNLRGQLRCILLVSHQEEFAEAFADVYRFELTDGSTQVTRAQR